MSSLNIYWGTKLLGNINYKCIPSNMPKIDVSTWPKVSDHNRCYVMYDGKTFCFMPFKTNYVNYKKIAVIVESPHKYEFDKNFNPLVPLNGPSGYKFSISIISRLQKWFSKEPLKKNTLFQIRIINPIQYQTSLYHLLNNQIPYISVATQKRKYSLNQYLRNKVWKLLFQEAAQITNCQVDFINRIAQYNPDYIVNCCTSFNKKTLLINGFTTLSAQQKEADITLKYIVRNSFISNSINIKYMEDYHPFGW